jgi:hypothetical protein
MEDIMDLRRCHTLIIVLIPFLLAACGRNVPPAPITNPASIETALASTAKALAQRTETAQGFTATPPVTPTETLTPTPRVSLNGTSLLIHEDQSALFIDHKAGIQLTIPSGWMPVRVNEDEYYKAFALDVALENPAIVDVLTDIQDANVNYHRVESIDIRPDHIPDGIVTHFNVLFQEGDIRTLEKWEQAERNRKSPYAKYRFISSSFPTLENGTRVLVIEESWQASGDKGTIYYRGVFFSLPTGTVILDFFTNLDFKDSVLPDFEQVINSLILITP